MSLRSKIVAQFRKPSGFLGALAGWIMAHRPSNIQRNAWTVDLLHIEPHHKILEFGFGPGLGLAFVADKLDEGCITGIDHSQAMLTYASRRLADKIESGKVRLKRGDLRDAETFKEGFDRIYSLNVVQFLPDLLLAYQILYKALSTGGVIATTYHPRTKNPTREQAMAMAEKVRAVMAEVGFKDIQLHTLELKSAPAICVTGTKPA